MIHTKKLHFQHKGIKFDATVTYSDRAFPHLAGGEEVAHYHVQLHTPIELDCGREVRTLSGLMSARRGNMYNHRFVYTEEDTVEEGEVNIYPLAIEKVLYSYHNREIIGVYKNKVETFEKAVDQKFASVLDALKEKKRVLKHNLRSGKIDNRSYQKRLKPIRLEREKIEGEVCQLKHRYHRRYFSCCELKVCYRSFYQE